MAEHRSSQKSLDKPNIELQELGRKSPGSQNEEQQNKRDSKVEVEEPELATLDVDSLQEIKVEETSSSPVERGPTPEEKMDFHDRDPNNVQESVKVKKYLSITFCRFNKIWNSPVLAGKIMGTIESKNIGRITFLFGSIPNKILIYGF